MLMVSDVHVWILMYGYVSGAALVQFRPNARCTNFHVVRDGRTICDIGNVKGLGVRNQLICFSPSSSSRRIFCRHRPQKNSSCTVIIYTIMSSHSSSVSGSVRRFLPSPVAILILCFSHLFTPVVSAALLSRRPKEPCNTTDTNTRSCWPGSHGICQCSDGELSERGYNSDDEAESSSDDGSDTSDGTPSPTAAQIAQTKREREQEQARLRLALLFAESLAMSEANGIGFGDHVGRRGRRQRAARCSNVREKFDQIRRAEGLENDDECSGCVVC